MTKGDFAILRRRGDRIVMPFAVVARILNDRNVATPTGKPWSAMTVIRARDRLAA
jgi:hypothetical protein